MVASGLHVSEGTLITVALVIVIAIGLLWLFGRIRRP